MVSKKTPTDRRKLIWSPETRPKTGLQGSLRAFQVDKRFISGVATISHGFAPSQVNNGQSDYLCAASDAPPPLSLLRRRAPGSIPSSGAKSGFRIDLGQTNTLSETASLDEQHKPKRNPLSGGHAGPGSGGLWP